MLDGVARIPLTDERPKDLNPELISSIAHVLRTVKWSEHPTPDMVRDVLAHLHTIDNIEFEEQQLVPELTREMTRILANKRGPSLT
jgi:hypothetical protein